MNIFNCYIHNFLEDSPVMIYLSLEFSYECLFIILCLLWFIQNFCFLFLRSEIFPVDRLKIVFRVSIFLWLYKFRLMTKNIVKERRSLLFSKGNKSKINISQKHFSEKQMRLTMNTNNFIALFLNEFVYLFIYNYLFS